MMSITAKTMLGLALSLVVTQTFAFDLPANLVGTWKENRGSDTPEVVVINSDKSITYSMDRQVGRDGEKVPYPTTCYYKIYGEIRDISTKDNDVRIEYTMNNYELIKPTGGSTQKNCETFIHDYHGDYNVWTIAMLNDGTIQDTWYKTIFKKS